MAVGILPIATSDEALLRQAVAGARDSLDELFRRYRSVAYRVAHRLLGNEADALDAVQEAFVKALVHLPSFQGRSSFKTWMLRVVSNAALDLGRQRGGARPSAWMLWGRSIARSASLIHVEPTRELERQDLRRKLNEALAQLPIAQRQTFVLHAEAELSYREVAETLDISIAP